MSYYPEHSYNRNKIEVEVNLSNHAKNEAVVDALEFAQNAEI